MNSTHLVDFGTGHSTALAIVCGNYFRPLHKFVFGGGSQIMPWRRIPASVTLIPCVVVMAEEDGSGLLGTSDNLN